MTIEIYIQSTSVIGEQARHYAIWIVENGETTILDAKASGSWGLGIDSGFFGNIFPIPLILNR